MKLTALYEGKPSTWKSKLGATGLTAAIAAGGLGLTSKAIDEFDAPQDQEFPAEIAPDPRTLDVPELKVQETQPEPEPEPRPIEQKIDHKLEFNEILKMMIPHEGWESHTYPDSDGDPTIGVGHYFIPESKEIFKQLFGNSVDFNAVLSGEEGLSDDQILALFNYDYQKHLARAKKQIPTYDTFPFYVRKAILNAIYRGDLGPKTTDHINEGEWNLVPDEYLDHRGYKNARRAGESGIITRMNQNHAAFVKYQRELQNRK